MNTLKKDKVKNIAFTDPIDFLIFEKGLRIRTLLIIKDLDLLVLILNNGKLIKSKLSYFERLKNASQKELDKWNLRGKGSGIRWEKLDEDLSLRGFIKDASLHATLHNLESKESLEAIVI